MSPYDIIRRLIETILLPKYPELKIKDIDSFALTNNREYDVRFQVRKKLPLETQEEIDSEVKTLFRMAGLDEIEQGRYRRNKIQVWFKTPQSKEWSFHSKPGYEH